MARCFTSVMEERVGIKITMDPLSPMNIAGHVNSKVLVDIR